MLATSAWAACQRTYIDTGLQQQGSGPTAWPGLQAAVAEQAMALASSHAEQAEQEAARVHMEAAKQKAAAAQQQALRAELAATAAAELLQDENKAAQAAQRA